MTAGRLFLVGPRASGKTTLALALAKAIPAAWLDTDALVQDRAGMSIAQLVEQQGWEAFRDLESAVLQDVCRPDFPCDTPASLLVVATGGGMILREANRQCMRQAGPVFWLDAPAELLVARLSRSLLPDQRPSLTGDDPVAEAARVAASREALYRESAHHVLDARLPLAELVRHVLTLCPPPAPGDPSL